MDLSQKVRLPENVLFRELDGEAVILNLDNEAYFGLDDVGTRMLTVLNESDSISSAHTLLLGEYNVASEQLQADMIELIENLQKNTLITIEKE